MKLIADSGSTKTDWLLRDQKGEILRATTTGMNPVMLGEEGVRDFLKRELLPQLPSADEIGELHFFGAGCTPELSPMVASVMRSIFASAEIEVDSDLTGAAKALCGHKAGIACILGTGSNSCLYDGRHIVQNTPALGYILGDEGSGAMVGRKFLNALLKGLLPEDMKRDFMKEYQLTLPIIINKVYREPYANRFLANTVYYVLEHIGNQDVESIVRDAFASFFRVNVAPYFGHAACSCPGFDRRVNFVGSMAHYFRKQLSEAAAQEGMEIGTIMKSPIEGLKNYFS